MQRPNVMAKLEPCRGLHRFMFILGTLALLACIAIMSNFYSLRSFLISDTFCNHYHPPSHGKTRSEVKLTVETVIQKIQREIKEMRELSKESSSSSSSSTSRYSSFLTDILSLIEEVQSSLQHVEGTYQQQIETEATHPLSRPKQQSDEPADYFLIEEIRKYVRIKPNRLGKQNFMGANGAFTSIGHACFSMKKELEEYMDYDIGEICNDDWKLAQKLMVHGCDPLPRRRCFSRAPQLYNKPLPINESMWKLPDNRNVRWSQYRCKNFACLASNSTGKGFFKCSDCFNLTHHEIPRWIEPVYRDPNSNLTSDFLISEVLDLKPGEIRIGLDFSVGTGTFAARMRELNVTVVSASINLGAPFSEMIALRGLIPLYLTINQRLPFFDNTLDLIHTTRFLDGWIDFVLLDFILFDWDRALRPGGLLWIDSFFCKEEDPLILSVAAGGKKTKIRIDVVLSLRFGCSLQVNVQPIGTSLPPAPNLSTLRYYLKPRSSFLTRSSRRASTRDITKSSMPPSSTSAPRSTLTTLSVSGSAKPPALSRRRSSIPATGLNSNGDSFATRTRSGLIGRASRRIN